MDQPSPSTSDASLRSLLGSTFWVSLPVGLLSFALPLYSKGLGASAMQVGIIFALFSFAPVIVRPFLGRALDRWGRRPFLLLGLLGFIFSMALFAASSTVETLGWARLAQGFGQAFMWLSAVTIVADLAAVTGRGHNFGQIDEAVNRGAILGASIGFGMIFFLLGRLDNNWLLVWHWMFVVFTLTTLVGFWTAWRGVPETRPAAALQDIESRPFSSQLLILMSIVFLTGASTAMVWPMLTIFLQDRLGAQAQEIAMAYLPAALLGTFLPSRLGRISDRFGRKGPMIAGLLTSALASALIPILPSLLPLAVLWAIESVGAAAAYPAERAFVADIAGEDLRGSSYGLYTFAFFLGSAIGPLVGGWLYDHAAPAMPFYLNTLALLLGALMVGVLLRKPQREGHETAQQPG